MIRLTSFKQGTTHKPTNNFTRLRIKWIKMETIKLGDSKKTLYLLFSLFGVTSIMCMFLAANFSFLDWMITASPIGIMVLSGTYLWIYYNGKKKVKQWVIK